MYQDPIFKAFIPSGCDIVFNFLSRSKDAKAILKKYTKWIVTFKEMVESSGLNFLLSKQIDNFGEFIHEPFTEFLRTITSEWMTQIRNADHQLKSDSDQYWMKELELREERGELNFQLDSLATSKNDETTANYQRKILPWD